VVFARFFVLSGQFVSLTSKSFLWNSLLFVQGFLYGDIKYQVWWDSLSFFRYKVVKVSAVICHVYLGVLNFSECSSFNSIFYYVPWVYVCVISALRLTGVSNAFPWMTGAIFFGFCGVYELSGPLMQWWLWPKDNGITNGNCTIWQYGALGLNPNNLMVSTHAAEALEERIFGVPLLAPYFHCAFGFGIAFAMCVLDFKWLPVSVFLGPAFGMMWDPPIRLAKIFLGASKSAAAPSFMLLSWLIPLFLGDPLQINQTFDPLLFLIPLLHHGFFVYNALFGAGVNLFPGNLKLVIIAISIISLAAHAKAAGLMSESFKIPLVCRSRLASLYAGVRGRAKLS
jgi:hypothetical protein